MATLEQLQQGLVKADAAGAKEDAQAFADAIREHPTFRQNAKESLESGKYKMGENYETLSKDEQRANMSKQIARSMGLKDNEVDVTQGMGQLGRFTLSFQATEQEKFKELEDRYGRENIEAIDIGGKTKLLYRDEKETGGKFRAVDEEGVSLADFFGDTAGHAAPVAGAIGAAVLTGGASIPLMAGAAALGTFAASAGQDVVVRAVSDEDIRLGEIAKRRGFEAAIGIPIDLVTGVGGKILGRTFAKRASIDSIEQLKRSTDDLNAQYKTNIDLTAAQASDPNASVVQSQRAGLDANGREAQWMDRQRDALGKIDAAIKGNVASNEPIEGVMAKMADGHLTRLDDYKARIDRLDDLAIQNKAKGKPQKENFIRREKAKVAKQREIEHKARVDAYEKQFNKMQRNVQKLDRVRGKEVRGQIAAKKTEVETNNNSLYERAYELTDTPQANTPVSVVNRALKSIDDSQFIPDSPELMALQALKKRIATDSSDLTFRELDSFVRQFGDRVNFKKEHGLKFNELSFKDAYKRLNAMWNTAVSTPRRLGARGAGKSAREAHMAARKDFRKNVLPYTDGEPAKILQQRVGGMSGAELADENVITESLKDTASVRNSLKAGADRQTLKDAYLNKILEAAEGGKEIKYDKNILDELYSTSGGRAKGITIKLNNINKMLRDAKIKPDTVTRDDIFEVLETYEASGAARAKNLLQAKKQAKEELAEANKEVLSRVLRGEQPAPEDINVFIDDIAKLNPGQIEKLTAKLSPSEKKSLERTGIDWFLEKAGRSSDGAQRTSAQTGQQALWNPDQMHKMLNDRVQRPKLDKLLGKDVVADYEKANRVLGAASALKETSEGAGSRVVITTGATGIPTPLIVSPGIPRWLGRKMLGVIHTSPIGKSMLRRYLSKPDTEAAEGLMQKMFFTAISTRSGMMSAANESSKDPQFAAWLEQSMVDQQEQGAQ